MKKRKTRSLFVLEIVMLFLSILIIAPCLMMIFGSFKTALEANHFNINLLQSGILRIISKCLKRESC